MKLFDDRHFELESVSLKSKTYHEDNLRTILYNDRYGLLGKTDFEEQQIEAEFKLAIWSDYCENQI